jgi:uncharacterized protein YigE (DUF2233 family)
LAWRPRSKGVAPASKPDGSTFDVVFINETKATVKLFWMNRQGQPKFYADILPGKQQRQRTRPGAVWKITDADSKPLGHFRVGDRTSRAVIPVKKPGNP